MIKNFEKYKQERLKLIDELENGRIDKNQFLNMTYDLFQDVKYVEPDTLKNVDEALYFYQYFNIKAKKMMLDLKNTDKASLDYRIMESSIEDYYAAKEEILLKFLKMLKPSDYTAYFVKTNSSKLKNRLVEIDVHILEKVIFHSLATRTHRYLRSIGKLNDEVKLSKIDDYVNTKY